MNYEGLSPSDERQFAVFVNLHINLWEYSFHAKFQGDYAGRELDSLGQLLPYGDCKARLAPSVGAIGDLGKMTISPNTSMQSSIVNDWKWPLADCHTFNFHVD